MTTDPATVAAARQLLGQLGISPADLHAIPSTTEVPTVAEYVRRVKEAAGAGARRTYGSYWDRMAAMWGERLVTSFAATDIEFFKNQSAAGAASRRNSRHGRHAGEHAVAAARALFNFAAADGIVAAGDSPAHRVAKPRRLPNTRRALTAVELEQINLAARISGNDAILDALLLRLHTETACRRGGAGPDLR